MSTPAPRSNFNKFLDRVLEDKDARAAFDDAQSRNAIVDALVKARRRLGLTQTEVAKRMGVKQPMISGFENEGSDPRLSTVQRYARAVDSAFMWDVCPIAEAPRPAFYHRQDVQVQLDVNHEEPSARARSWVPTNVPYARRLFRLAA